MMKGQKLPPIFLLLCTVQQVHPGLPATNLIPRISPSLNSPSWNWVSFLLNEQGWWLISAITLECLSLQQLASSVRRGSHRIGFTPLQSTVDKRLQRLPLVTAGEGMLPTSRGWRPDMLPNEHPTTHRAAPAPLTKNYQPQLSTIPSSEPLQVASVPLAEAPPPHLSFP